MLLVTLYCVLRRWHVKLSRRQSIRQTGPDMRGAVHGCTCSVPLCTLFCDDAWFWFGNSFISFIHILYRTCTVLYMRYITHTSPAAYVSLWHCTYLALSTSKVVPVVRYYSKTVELRQILAVIVWVFYSTTRGNKLLEDCGRGLVGSYLV